jgi:hypothetical protein
MILKGISVRVDNKEKQKLIGRTPRCVESLFMRHIGKLSLPDISYINIYLSDSIKADETQKVGSFIDLYINFDFDEFAKKKKKYEIKEYILNTIYDSLKKLSHINNWDIDSFSKAYEKCIAEKLLNRWFYKNKLFRSPNRKYYVGLYINYDIDKYEIFIALYDKAKKELVRSKIFEQQSEVFCLSWASWKNTNEIFYYKFSGPKKEFSCKIQDLLNGKQYDVDTKKSDFFK